jgi:hypothetical protein
MRERIREKEKREGERRRILSEVYSDISSTCAKLSALESVACIENVRINSERERSLCPRDLCDFSAGFRRGGSYCR